MIRILIFCLLCFLIGCKEGKQETLFEIIDRNHPLLEGIFNAPEKYELQILYTRIDRDDLGEPVFETISYRYDSLQYFYPASTVKMPAAFLALEKINEINKGLGSEVISGNTAIVHKNARSPQTAQYSDSTAMDNRPTLAHYIDKVFVVSDNDAYNRIYEFLGQDYINQKLKEKGLFTNSRIRHRVGISGFTTEDNRYTNPVKFLDEEDNVLFEQGGQFAKNQNFPVLNNILKGQGYFVDSSEITVMEPFDMSEKNFINLKDLEKILINVVFPEAVLVGQRFELTKDQYEFLYQSMLRLPKDFEFLMKDTTTEYYDGYVKFLMFGDSHDPIPDHIKIMNKVGNAYGYLTDCAYIFDTKNGVEFFLTATIHVNENGIYNDGKYEYDDKGIPFLAELGRQVYQYELMRERKNKPTFDKYLSR